MGRREHIRAASGGAKSAWDTVKRDLPKAPPHALTSGKVRPKSATAAHTTRPLAGIGTSEYKLHGLGLEKKGGMLGVSANSAGAAGHSSSSFGPGGKQRPSSSHSYAPGTPSSSAMLRPPSGYGHPGLAGHANGLDDDGDVLEESRRELAHMRALQAADPNYTGAITEAHLATLEDAIRDAVRARRSVYEGSKEMLLRIFKEVDDGSGDVDINEFCAVCAEVGVSVSPAESQALFKRYGFETVMPYEQFVHNLVTQPARQLASEMPVRKGAFQAGYSANFHGKIIYPKCRKPVYTPSDWDPALAERSSDLPDARLVLQYIYGYQGKENTAQNLFYTADNKLVYFIAGVGVVYSRPPANCQTFFLGHTDDVLSLALCAAPVKFDGQTYPARTLVATGQITSVDEGPYICIWDSRACATGPDCPPSTPELMRLRFDKEDRGFTALAFSPCGKRLAAVATDNYHTVYVYDWRKQRKLSSSRGQMGDPPQVYGVEWNPHQNDDDIPPAFVTFGRKHIKLWTCEDPKGNSGWKSKQMSFGKLPMQNVTSAQWLPPRGGFQECLIAAGMAEGNIYLFRGAVAIKAITAHRRGPQVNIDGQPGFYGVRGLRLCKKNNVLISGGADGTVLQWDVSDGTLQESRFVAPSVSIPSPFGPGDKWAPCIRSLDYSEELDRIVIGTNHCDVKEISGEEVDVLMYGHSGDVYQLAWHPALPNVMVTASDSGHVHVWDATLRQMTHLAAVGFMPRAAAFSSKPVASTNTYHIAVGGSKGQIKVLDEGSNLCPIHSCKDSVQGVSDIMYSPNNRFMAASTYDTWIDIYNVDRGYARVARCTGHSATVRGVDWSLDSSIIMSHSADLELLYWNARTGKQVTLNQRDTEWATYTCNLGFPVMGIWPPESDGTDVNSVDRSKSCKYLATADDDGMVKLFNYPVVVDDAPHRAYRGHCSHVMGVRFNKDDSLLCSAGGKDWAIFQFRVVPIPLGAPPPPKPKAVWGALDPQGKVYGYTTAPVPLAPGAPSASNAKGGRADGYQQQQQQQPGLHLSHHSSLSLIPEAVEEGASMSLASSLSAGQASHPASLSGSQQCWPTQGSQQQGPQQDHHLRVQEQPPLPATQLQQHQHQQSHQGPTHLQPPSAPPPPGALQPRGSGLQSRRSTQGGSFVDEDIEDSISLGRGDVSV